MKRFISCFLTLLFLSLTCPVWGFDSTPMVTNRANNEAIIFSDPAYTKATHNFSTGQMVYLHLVLSGSGEKVLRLLNSAKEEIQRIEFRQEGNGPYTYSAAFTAPNTVGVYYVDIKIQNNSGFSFASQQNINVGNQTGSSSATANANSVVIQGNQNQPTQIPKNTPKPSKTPTVTPTINPALTATEASAPSQPMFFSLNYFFKKLWAEIISRLIKFF